jgi:hypothetical protein
MHTHKLIKILLLCLVVLALAAFVAGLPWGDTAARSYTIL